MNIWRHQNFYDFWHIGNRLVKPEVESHSRQNFGRNRAVLSDATRAADDRVGVDAVAVHIRRRLGHRPGDPEPGRIGKRYLGNVTSGQSEIVFKIAIDVRYDF